MNQQTKQKLISYLDNFVTFDRRERIEEVLKQRTRHLTIVLEDIYQPHNASAVLRSCDCMGIQDVHVIENENRFKPSKGIAIGSDQWLSVYSYSDGSQNNTEQCFRKLRENGYRIVATTPHEEDVTIDELPVKEKTALIFGAELTGLSDYALKEADGYAQIPIYGFSESYNISVSAALCMYDFVSRLRKTEVDWNLSNNEQADLRLKWLEQSIRAGQQLKEKFMAEHANTSPNNK